MATIAELLDEAYRLHSAGEWQAAAEIYLQILRARPKQVDALYRLGVLAHQRGDHSRSRQYLEQAINERPQVAAFHAALGMVLRASGKLEEAIEAYRRSLAIDAQQPVTWHNLGNVLVDSDQLLSAVEAFQTAIDADPRYASAHMQLGTVYYRLGNGPEAIRALRRAVQLDPENADTHNNLANAYRLGGHLQQAIEAYQRALTIDGQRPDTYYNLGVVLEDAGELDRAYQCQRRAVQLDPQHAAARAQLVLQQLHLCDWHDLQANIECLRALADDSQGQISPFVMTVLPSTPAEQKRMAEKRAASIRMPPSDSIQPRPKNKLTVGYLSADFRKHPVAYLIAEMIERHNRERFQVNAYSFGRDDGSSIRGRLVKAFDRFVDVRQQSFRETADRIRADNVDILVDLMGYTEPCRTEILACRPAAIQVNFLGYPGTLGADFIDYIVADDAVIPLEQRASYTEQVLRMPECFFVADSGRPQPETIPPRSSLGLPDKAFVFCCFNKSYKFNPPVLDSWARLLGQTGDSCLWISQPSALAQHNLVREFQRRGIEPQRLQFAARTKTLAEHLARIQSADLFLDTWPYNAHTTASDALWVGCPVLTYSGSTFAARVAGSLLRALDLPELITSSVAEYEQTAISLARAPERLAELRQRLRRTREESRLFDGGRFARDLERGYEAIWQLYLDGEPPRPIEIAAL